MALSANRKAPQDGIGIEQLLEFERKGHIKTESILRSKADADAMFSAVTGEYMRRRLEVVLCDPYCEIHLG